jgi:hypothetical protein
MLLSAMVTIPKQTGETRDLDDHSFPAFIQSLSKVRTKSSSTNRRHQLNLPFRSSALIVSLPTYQRNRSSLTPNVFCPNHSFVELATI